MIRNFIPTRNFATGLPKMSRLGASPGFRGGREPGLAPKRLTSHQGLLKLPAILLSFAIVVLLSSAFPVAGQDIQAMRKLNPRQPAPIDINPERVTAAGIQIFAGKHIRLYSDLRDPAKLQELITIFDAAAPLWCKYCLLYTSPSPRD